MGLPIRVFVILVLIDFSKAFDIVDRGIPTAKLTGLNMPLAILSWIFSFLTDRTQQVKHGFHLSLPKHINTGIVQGSGLGLDSLPSNRQHLSYDVCLEVEGKIIRSCAQS